MLLKCVFYDKRVKSIELSQLSDMKCFLHIYSEPMQTTFNEANGLNHLNCLSSLSSFSVKGCNLMK